VYDLTNVLNGSLKIFRDLANITGWSDMGNEYIY